MAWTPDLEGEAERVAAEYRWAPPGPGHRSQIGVADSRGVVLRVGVRDVADWELAGDAVDRPGA
jgi:hypothetical protein